MAYHKAAVQATQTKPAALWEPVSSGDRFMAGYLDHILPHIRLRPQQQQAKQGSDSRSLARSRLKGAPRARSDDERSPPRKRSLLRRDNERVGECGVKGHYCHSQEACNTLTAAAAAAKID